MADTTPTGTKQEVKLPRDIITRWGGRKELFDHGWVGVPTRFLESRAEMRQYRLTPTEALFVIDLMAHKWDATSPFPGYKRLSKWMGTTEGYVRKIARSLETKGFLRRLRRIGDTNKFDLEPLFTKLANHIKSPPKVTVPRKRPKAAKARQGPRVLTA